MQALSLLNFPSINTHKSLNIFRTMLSFSYGSTIAIDKKSYVTPCALKIPFHLIDFSCFLIEFGRQAETI